MNIIAKQCQYKRIEVGKTYRKMNGWKERKGYVNIYIIKMIIYIVFFFTKIIIEIINIF